MATFKTRSTQEEENIILLTHHYNLVIFCNDVFEKTKNVEIETLLESLHYLISTCQLLLASLKLFDEKPLSQLNLRPTITAQVIFNFIRLLQTEIENVQLIQNVRDYLYTHRTYFNCTTGQLEFVNTAIKRHEIHLENQFQTQNYPIESNLTQIPDQRKPKITIKNSSNSNEELTLLDLQKEEIPQVKTTESQVVEPINCFPTEVEITKLQVGQSTIHYFPKEQKPFNPRSIQDNPRPNERQLINPVLTQQVLNEHLRRKSQPENYFSRQRNPAGDKIEIQSNQDFSSIKNVETSDNKSNFSSSTITPETFDNSYFSSSIVKPKKNLSKIPKEERDCTCSVCKDALKKQVREEQQQQLEKEAKIKSIGNFPETPPGFDNNFHYSNSETEQPETQQTRRIRSGKTKKRKPDNTFPEISFIGNF